MADLTEALPLSALSIARVLGQTPDCVKLLDREGGLLWMNANGLCAMEIDDFPGFIGRNWSELWPASRRLDVEQSLNISLEDGLSSFSGFCPTNKGSERWWDVTVHPLQDDAGALMGFLSISRDVTDRENQRLALEAVVSEMRHRLKNSYTIVCSLMSGLTRGNPEFAEFSSQFQQRVLALAKAQSLFSHNNERAQLDELVALLLAPFQGQDKVEIRVSSDRQILIDSRVSDAIALTLGELIVNSAKHGAIAKGGRIAITAALDADALNLIWEESGLEKVIATTREGGQGLQIVKRMLSASKAELDLQWNEFGPVAKVKFSEGFVVAEMAEA